MADDDDEVMLGVDLDWSFSLAERERIASSNPYVKSLLDSAGLALRNPEKVKNAFDDKGELGLFFLFFTPQQIEAIRVYTCERLAWSGQSSTTRGLDKTKFNAVLGLELAMSILRFGAIADYWDVNKMFSGHEDFRKVMSRDDFTRIRSHYTLYNSAVFDSTSDAGDAESLSIITRDPMFHSRKVLDNFQRRCAEVAVPIGPVTLDENTFPTKARTGAKTYLPSKPDKYGIRFYALTGWKSVYLFSMVDNGSGNKTGLTSAEYFLKVSSRKVTTTKQL